MTQATTRTAATALAFALSLILAPACGGDDPGQTTQPPPPPPKWQNVAPGLFAASPNTSDGELGVGDDLVVLGKDFIDKTHGQTVLVIKGTYFDSDGNNHVVDLQKSPKRVNKGKLTWRMFPNIVFHPNGDKLGQFVGQIQVINQGNDGSKELSSPLPVNLTIKPSLIPRTMRPTSSGCQSIVETTLENTGFSFVLEAVGLRAGTKDAPLTFHWTFLRENWTVKMSHGSFDPDSILPETGAFILQDEVTNGRVSLVQDLGDRNFFLKVGSDLFGDTRLKELRTAAIPEGGDGYIASVNVAAVDASGKTARLAIPIRVTRMATMLYDGEQKIAERFQPRMVSDCIPGGDIGRQASYSENTAETRARSMSFQYNANVGVNLGLPSNPFALGVNFSAGFGVDINSSISTTNSVGKDLSGQILPGMYGVFYRQTTKTYRIGRLLGHTVCGQEVDLGTAILTDWLFTPDLATGPKCAPASNLPPAQKFAN
jgi:hypothetical protein